VKKKGKEIMKKNIKKCFALLLAVVMTLTMAMTVFAKIDGADTKCSLEIKDGDAYAANTYSVYKIASFDVEKGSDNKTVYTNIKVENPYIGIFKPDEVKAQSKDNNYMVALSNNLATASASATVTPVAKDVTTGRVENLPTGYYLIKETAHAAGDIKLATKYILVAVDKAIKTVTLKTSEASITKKIVLEGTEDTLVDKDVVAVGDTVKYQIDSTIPEYPSYATNVTYLITDTMSAGLTPCGASQVKVSIWNNAENKYVECPAEKITVNVNGQVITVSLTRDYVIANPGGSIRVTLSGVLNTNANIGTNGNPNSVDLTYTNNWDENTTHKTPEDTVITYTGELAIEKVDSVDTNKKLAGAEFAVYAPKNYATAETPATGVNATIKANETTYYYYKTVTTGENGKAAISGLDQGIYYAVETKAPAGYNVDSTPQKIELTVVSNPIDEVDNLEKTGDTVTPNGITGEAANTNATAYNTVTWKNNGNLQAQIANTKGTTLPGTGGIGTTLFTFGGIALILIAGVMFIVYTRKQKKQS
jgi:fimbrial isopeptide formation D2 family protein/LPXTG-motif cell wall-anchored protein